MSSHAELPAPSTAAPAPPGEARAVPQPRWRRLSLLWRVFAANTAVFVVAFAIVAWAPVTVHRVATGDELLVLAVLLVVMLAVNLWLLRRTLEPLRRLAAMMGEVDPTQPGRRALRFEGAGREVGALAGALNGMLDRIERERRESGRRIAAAQEHERLRVARELHDEVGQTLTAIALRAERAAGLPAEQPRALAEIAQTALHSLEDVRRIGRELRPEALDDLGLVNALVALCRRVDRQGGVRVRRDLDWHLPPLDPEVELVIYRTAQEALTNVLRHAGAGEARVALHGSGTAVVLEVVDDGCGIPAAVSERGLRGLRERAMVIGAQLDVGRVTGAGTRVQLSVRAARD
jgi:two-component system sensor histidine kinase UhpB